MKAGKLKMEFLQRLIKKYTISDPRVVLGPGVGEDAAVIDPGQGFRYYWVVTSDPITFATDQIGHYGVVVNLNDIATRGAIPKWFIATLLFPKKGTDSRLVEKIFRQIHAACERFHISTIGGHTEITGGIDKTILSGTMIGEVEKKRLVTTGGARAGDLLLLVKGVCIEGTSIIAKEKKLELMERGLDPSLLRRAKNYIFHPGIEVFQAARLACDAVSIHSMHDPTEGGLINGVVEVAEASQKEIEVDLSKVHVYPESRILCEAFGLNPLRVIASGALLLTIAPADLSGLQNALARAFIRSQVIGRVKRGPARVLNLEGRRRRELHPSPRDEILKILE